MGVSQEEQEAIIGFVRKEPRAISEVARRIERSWVTAERYVQDIAERTGVLRIKVFRKGTRGALKLVYYDHADRPMRDELEKELYKRIRSGTAKRDFRFFDIYQWADDAQKTARAQPLSENAAAGIIRDLESCERQLLVFSGNLSVLKAHAGGTSVADVLARLVGRGVTLRILTRVSFGGLSNLAPVHALGKKHPERVEIRHAEQPLRGFLIDGSYARFTDEEHASTYRAGELEEDLRITYAVRDPSWVQWLSRVFWNLYRPAMDAKRRQEELERLALHNH